MRLQVGPTCTTPSKELPRLQAGLLPRPIYEEEDEESKEEKEKNKLIAMAYPEKFEEIEKFNTFAHERFEIKKEHLQLLQQMYVQWQSDEYGAPEIDPKRPYGNSDVEQDLIEILGRRNAHIKPLNKFHRETELALQICLCLQKFEVGKYVRHEFHNDWIRVEG